MTYPYTPHLTTADYGTDLTARERDARELELDAGRFGYEHMTPDERVEYSRMHADAHVWGHLAGILHGTQSNLLRLANQPDTPPEVAKAARTTAAQVDAIKQPIYARYDELREMANNIARRNRS